MNSTRSESRKYTRGSLRGLPEIKLNDTKRRFESLRHSFKSSKDNETERKRSNTPPEIEQESAVEQVEKKTATRKESTRSQDNLLESNEHFELFDPSMRFTSIHRCYYWSKNDRIRKGKIFLTASELIFKCSGMPFVKLRLHFSDITDVVKIRNFKHRLETVLSVQTNFGSSYAFYKFRFPKSVIRASILDQIGKFKKNDEMADMDPEHTHLLRLRKLSQPISNFTHVIKTSINNRSSLEDLDEDTKLEVNDIGKPEPNRFRSLRRLKLDRSKSNDVLNTQGTQQCRAKYIKNQLSRVFSRRSYEQSSQDEEEQIEIKAESSSLTSMVDSTADESDDTESLLDEDTMEQNEVVEQPNFSPMVIETKSSTLITLFFTLIAIIIFFVLALNNFMKISLIEKKILDLM